MEGYFRTFKNKHTRNKMLSQRFELTRVKPLEETGDAKYCRMADMWKGTCLKNEM